MYLKSDPIPATFTISNFLVNYIDDAVDDLTRLGVCFETYDEGELKTDERDLSR